MSFCLLFSLSFAAFFEPTDMRIAGKPFTLPADLVRQIKFISPNIYELNEIAKALGGAANIPNGLPIDELLASHVASLKSLATQVNEHVDNILITMGSRGLLLVRKNGVDTKFFSEHSGFLGQSGQGITQMRLYPAQSIDYVINVSGAGDSFSSGFITAMIRGKSEAICVSVGFQSAITALQGLGAVPDHYFGLDHQCWRRAADHKDF